MTYRQYILQQRSGVRTPDSLQHRAALDEAFTFTRASFLAYLDTVAMRDTSATLLRPDALNRLGYELLRQQQRTSSLAVFALVTRLAPWSANALDSYAEALEDSNDSTAAFRAASRALELATTDSTVTPAARDNLLQINRDRLARLRK